MKFLYPAILCASLSACGPDSEAAADLATATIAAAQGGSRAPAAPRTAAPLPPGVYAVQKLEIIDSSGFERPMVAGTILAPAGWSMQGGVVWSPLGPCGADFASTVSLHSPDGASAVRVVPAPGWAGARTTFPLDRSQLQCPEAFYAGAREFLDASAQRMFPGARVIDYRPLPEKTKPLEEMMAQLPALPAANGLEQRINFDAGEALVAYTEEGRDMRAAVSTMVMITRTRMADMINPGQIALDQITGSPSELVVVSAPNGALDLGLRERLQKSIQFNAEWVMKINAYFTEKNRIAAKGAADRHAIVMDGIKKRGDIINGMYDARDLSSDRNQREVIESIRGVETYDDPQYGGPVQLDNNYSHAWRVTGQDAYIMTNDANFNPGQYGLEAQKLEVTR